MEFLVENEIGGGRLVMMSLLCMHWTSVNFNYVIITKGVTHLKHSYTPDEIEQCRQTQTTPNREINSDAVRTSIAHFFPFKSNDNNAHAMHSEPFATLLTSLL